MKNIVIVFFLFFTLSMMGAVGPESPFTMTLKTNVDAPGWRNALGDLVYQNTNQNQLFQVPTKLIAFGESVTWLSAPSFPPSWAYQLTNIYTFQNLLEFRNYAINGGKLSNIWNIIDAAITNAPSGTTQGIAFVMIGANDIGVGDASTLSGATNFVLSLSNLFNALHTNNWKVCALTILPAWWLSDKDETRMSCQRYINGEISILTNADWIVRADYLLPNNLDTRFYYDGTHPTNAGSRLIAISVADAISHLPPYRPDGRDTFFGETVSAYNLSIIGGDSQVALIRRMTSVNNVPVLRIADGGGTIYFYGQLLTDWAAFQIAGGERRGIIFDGTGSGSYQLVLGTNSNVGIATTNVPERLTVLGNISCSGFGMTTNGVVVSSNSWVNPPTLTFGQNFYCSSNGVPHVIWMDQSGTLTTNRLVP